MRSCAKCGGLATRDIWCPAAPEFQFAPAIREALPEHIRRTCSNCGHIRDESPLTPEPEPAPAVTIVHALPDLPNTVASVTPCCGRRLTDLPAADIATDLDALVTCAGPP